MSADNGIYILKMKNQSRIIETSAIENLWWSFLINGESKELVPTRVFSYYYNSIPMTFNKAQARAFELEREILYSDFPVLEYGINTIQINKTWKEIINEAKELLPKEIESIKTMGEKYQWELKELLELEKLLNKEK
jgi:hypothetical protein